MFQAFEAVNGYRLYSVTDTLTNTKYDCIYSYNGPTFFDSVISLSSTKFRNQPKEQIIPFCLQSAFIDQESCRTNGIDCSSFEQLRRKDIKSSELILWNAPVTTVDQYESYLRKNNDELRHSCFCNCTDKMYFGEQCQYTFDLIFESFETLLSSHFSHLSPITIDEAAMMEDADVTCYKRDPLCNGGCLDWRQICNGIVDCETGYDEAVCDSLEFNECGTDEYRCHIR
jgi:hypothetical protein